MTDHHEAPIKRTNPSGDVRWVARYTAPDGRRLSAGTFKLKRDAQAAITAAYKQDETRARDGSLVGAYAKTWTERHPRSSRTNLTANSRMSKLLEVRVDGKPLRDWRLDELERRHTSQLLDVLLRQGRAATGVRQMLAVLSAMYEDAINDGHARTNPVMGLHVRAADPRVRKAPRRPVVMSWEEMHTFAAAAGQFEPMVRVLADCGLRLGELLPLERADVDGDVLHVRRTSWRRSVTDGTKTDHGEAYAGRTVPLAASTRGLLDGMPRRIDTRLLFPDPSGGLWHERSFYRHVWYPARERSGMQVRPHDFRHSYVSLMRAAGIDPSDLAKASGHTVETATSRYTHSTGISFDAMRGVVGRV